MVDDKYRDQSKTVDSVAIPRAEQLDIQEKINYQAKHTLDLGKTLKPMSRFAALKNGRMVSIDNSSDRKLYSYIHKADRTGFDVREVAQNQYGGDAFELLEDGSILSAGRAQTGAEEVARFIPSSDGSFAKQAIGNYEVPPPKISSFSDSPKLVARWGEGLVVAAGTDGLNIFSQRPDGTFDRSMHRVRDLTAGEFHKFDRINLLSDGRFAICQGLKIGVMEIRSDGHVVTHTLETFNNNGLRSFVPLPDGSFFLVTATGYIYKYTPQEDGRFSKIQIKTTADDLKVLGGGKVFLSRIMGGRKQGGVYSVGEDGTVTPDSNLQFPSKNAQALPDGKILNLVDTGKVQILDGE